MVVALGAGIAGGAAINAGSSIISGNEQSQAAQSAMNYQQTMGNEAVGSIQNFYNKGMTDLTPYSSAGAAASPELQALLGLGGSGAAGAQQTLQNLPGYQFTYGQGQQANNASMTARGLGLSGAQMRGASNYAEGAASTQYNNYVSQLQNLLGLGESAGSSEAQLASNAGGQIANVRTGQGNALAAGTIASGNANAGIASNVGSSLASATTGLGGLGYYSQLLGAAGGSTLSSIGGASNTYDPSASSENLGAATAPLNYNYGQ